MFTSATRLVGAPPLRRVLTPLCCVIGLIALGWWAQRFDNRPSGERQPPAASSAPAATSATPAGQVVKIGEGKFKKPLALAATENGELLALDEANPLTLRRFARDGREVSTQPLPATLGNAANLLAAGQNETVFVARRGTPGVWRWQADRSAQPTKIEPQFPVAGLAARDGVLWIAGNGREGVLRIKQQDSSRERILLSDFPSRGGWSQLRVRKNGDLYLHAENEGLVYRFDADGKLLEKIGGGGPPPPQIGLPADHVSRHFDIDDNGNLFWTMGDYGALLKIDAASGIATHFFGRESKGRFWTGNFPSLTDFVFSGNTGFVLDNGMRRITAIPASWVAPGAPKVARIDTRAFGLGFTIQSDAPYKLFTSASVPLRLAFESGNRTLRQPRLDLTVRNYDGNVVAQQTSTLDLPGSGTHNIPLPALDLPKLGWYQVEAALFADKSAAAKTTSAPLIERVHFVTRTFTDADLPIPEREYSGWDDLRTHKMVGMGLHRFALHSFEKIDDLKDDVPAARAAGVPYYFLLIRPEDCTPEKVRVVVGEAATYGDKAPLIELVNEPDLNMSARAYVEILRRCRDAIKQVSPKARIMGPSVCGIRLDWFEDFFRAGGGELIDVVSLHTYERHNSMDAYHWNWKFTRVLEVLRKYNCQDKPLYQTEHGFMGSYAELILRPQWQARQLTLEKLVLDRFGIGDDQYCYYYVNEGGYRDYSAYVVNRARELFPAAAMTRVRRHFLKGKTFQRALDFGAPGNWLLIANHYSGPREDVFVLQNCGAWKPITVQASLPAGARVLDCWGNALPVNGNLLEVGRAPLYVLVPRAASAKPSFRLAPFGRDIAPRAKITTDSGKGQTSAPLLINGQLEFDFQDQPLRTGFLAADDELPVEITFEWDKPQAISKAILYASLADNDKSTPLDYDVLARMNNQWRKVDEVRQKPAGRILPGGNIACLTDYDNAWIFEHRLEHGARPLVTDALKLRFLRTTYGQYPDASLATAVGNLSGQNFRPRVELRELQIFSRSNPTNNVE